MTDENAMFEILAKFLGKEGYQTKRVFSVPTETEDLALVIVAPTRGPNRSGSWIDNLKKIKPAVVIIQCCDEDYADADANVIVLKDRPLNLRQLSETIRTALRKSGSVVSNAK